MLSWPTGPAGPEVDIEQADQRVASGAQMVAVREKDEWDEVHVPGSVHISLGELPQRASELKPGREVVAICRSGNPSITAVKTLNWAEFADARSVSGGIVAWARGGKPIER